MTCPRRKERITFAFGEVDNTIEVDKDCHKLAARLSLESVHSKLHRQLLIKSLAFVQCYCCEFCQFIQNIEIHQQWHWKNALFIGSRKPSKRIFENSIFNDTNKKTAQRDRESRETLLKLELLNLFSALLPRMFVE